MKKEAINSNLKIRLSKLVGSFYVDNQRNRMNMARLKKIFEKRKHTFPCRRVKYPTEKET